MQLSFKNTRLEHWLIGTSVLAAVLVVGTFLALFGFDEALISARILYGIQITLLFYFVIEKILRSFNAQSRWIYWRQNWFEVVLFALLAGITIGQQGLLHGAEGKTVFHAALGGYLLLQVVTKVCRSTVHLASLGRNPTRTLIASFLVLIVVGAGALCLPRATTGTRLGFVDALFTATSATCVTGLVVLDTGQDFSLMGQVVILGLIQLGGLGIVIFGAVLSLLLGQAFTLRESAAMQDLLSAQTLSRISHIIAFIFIATLLIEALGTLGLYCMWDNHPDFQGGTHHTWFYSLFHAVSAFCNAGFALFGDSLARYRSSLGIYSIICPLIIVGGLGFSVLFNLSVVGADRVQRFFSRHFDKPGRPSAGPPKRVTLQSKIVLTVSFCLIILGAALILLCEHWANPGETVACPSIADALFQSITARTAGFNTVDIESMAGSSRFALTLLMLVGGSPGSTAGGIKTVTLAVVIMTVITNLRKRSEVEMFKRSIRPAIVGRAITVVTLFVLMFFVATFALSITEHANPRIDLSDIAFECASALGTVGLTTGITPLLTAAGKMIIIAVMLIGRLGPLTLLAALTFDLKPVQYNYPQEAIMVG
jgi:trk system potassium uptake protein